MKDHSEISHSKEQKKNIFTIFMAVLSSIESGSYPAGAVLDVGAPTRRGPSLSFWS
jgi:hypothetical protein